jgi:hypothetical protein
VLFIGFLVYGLSGPMLFLNLYDLPAPQRWRLASQAGTWYRLSPEEREEAAGIVRRWLEWAVERGARL